MTPKKIIIIILAIISIAAAFYGVWSWQESAVNQPTREERNY